MEPRYVVVEFWGGPLDGFHNGWTTNQKVVLPEKLTAENHAVDSDGAYHIRMRGVHHYVYQWREAS
jgi:hypothetical protein